MIKGLKIRFVCINMLIVTLMLVVIFSLVLHNTGLDMARQSFHTIERIHELPYGSPLPGDVMDSYFMILVSPQGEQRVISHGLFQDYEEQTLLQIAEEARKTGEDYGELKNHDLRYIRRMTRRGGALVFVDTSIEGRIMRGLVENCIRIYLVSFALFLGISIALAQWAVRPVDRAWKAQRQFVADASHELKTPLTVIMTNAELLAEGLDQPQSAQFLQSILSMSRQMRGLVEGLLDLARVDNGVEKAGFCAVDFSGLVNRCILPFEPLFFEKGMPLDARVEDGLTVMGNDTALAQVVDILLDNAVKYGTTAEPAVLELRRQGKHVLLRVATAGELLSDQEVRDIFKRFYRIDKARAMNHSYGLGLPIAQSIAAQHRGKIWAESRQGVNSFFVQLPIGDKKAS